MNDILLDTMVQWAIERGFAVVPCEPNSKQWLTLNPIFTLTDWLIAKRQWGQNINAGLHLNGSNLAAVDLDCGVHGLMVVLEKWGVDRTLTFKSRRGFHLLFDRGSGQWGTVGSEGNLYDDIFELGHYFCGNAINHYVMLPGSVHPSGTKYRILWDIPVARLPLVIVDHVEPWREYSYDDECYEDDYHEWSSGN